MLGWLPGSAAGTASFVMAVFLADATFTNTVTLGSIIVGILLALAGLAVFGYGVKWKSSWQVASTQAEELRKALTDTRERSDRIETMLADAHTREVVQQETISRLEQLPNLEKVLTLMAESTQHADDNAQKRLELGLENVKVLIETHTQAVLGALQNRRD